MDGGIARRVRYGSLSVVEAGEPTSPVLLLLHGIGSSGDAFLGQVPDLADRWRLLAPDAPGYGASDDPVVPPGIDGFTEAMVGLLDEAGVDQAVVLGISWGGVIATRIALKHGDRVQALVLVDTSCGSGTSSEQAEMMRNRAQTYATNPETFVKDRTPLLVAETTPRYVVDQVAAIMTDACRMPGYGYAASSLAEADHTGDLGKVRVPTLVVVGEHDRVCPPSDSKLLAAGIPDSIYVEISQSGHLPNQECPEEFNRVVGEWLDLLPG